LETDEEGGTVNKDILKPAITVNLKDLKLPRVLLMSEEMGMSVAIVKISFLRETDAISKVGQQESTESSFLYLDDSRGSILLWPLDRPSVSGPLPYGCEMYAIGD
jgi:hypothetical protein